MFKTLNDELILNMLPKKSPDSNKGDYGHVLVIGGSIGMAGSVCMTAESALRSGAGLVTVAVPDCILNVVATKLTECMTLPLPSEDGQISQTALKTISQFIPKVNTIVIGMGGRVCIGHASIIDFLLEEFEGTLVIDADGLNILAKHDDLLLKKRKCELVLTPHPGEMSRLLRITCTDVQSNRENVAESFSNLYNLCLVLKGMNTVISSREHKFINPTGNAGMAKGGSGDVLAGMIAGFSAQGAKKECAACLGTYLHGLSADFAVKDKTEYCMTATDIISYLPSAFKKILGK